MAGEIEAKLKAERMFAEAQAKALGGPYANISKEYVNKYMDSSSLSKALAERVSTNYSLGYLSGWAGIPGDMLNALTSWAVSGIPDQRLRQQAKRSLTVAGTEEIGEAMGADVESEAFQWGTVGLPGLEDLFKRSPYLATVFFARPKRIDAVFKVDPIGGYKTLKADETLEGLPNIEEGFTRLFRAEGGKYSHDDVWKPGTVEKNNPKNLPGKFFTDDVDYADYYRETYGPGAELFYVDVPTNELDNLRGLHQNEFIVPVEE